jgi:hypothetical protein
MTSRGRPKLDSREWIESGEGDVPLTAKLTSPPRDISEVTSTEMYALPRGALDDATGRATSDGAFAYVVLASRQVVLATRDTVKPTVELEDPKSWSVARVTVSPAGTATLKRRYAMEAGRRAITSLLALPKFRLGLSAMTWESATGVSATVEVRAAPPPIGAATARPAAAPTAARKPRPIRTLCPRTRMRTL